MQVEKGQAQFYEMEISQEDIEQGFVIGVHSKTGSKFKLLLLEKTGPKQWEIHHQVHPDLSTTMHAVLAYILQFPHQSQACYKSACR